jgi:uncharacterized OB-fold protein
MQLHQCLDCGNIGELTRQGKCSRCGSEAVTEKIFVSSEMAVATQGVYLTSDWEER